MRLCDEALLGREFFTVRGPHGAPLVRSKTAAQREVQGPGSLERGVATQGRPCRKQGRPMGGIMVYPNLPGNKINQKSLFEAAVSNSHLPMNKLVVVSLP